MNSQRSGKSLRDGCVVPGLSGHYWLIDVLAVVFTVISAVIDVGY